MMSWTPLAYGRKAACLKCEHWSLRGTVKRARCEACDPRQELTGEFLGGPVGGCPLDKWEGVDPVDAQAQADARLEETYIRDASEAAKLLKAFSATIPAELASIETELTRLVEEGCLSGAVAAKVENLLLAEAEAKK